MISVTLTLSELIISVVIRSCIVFQEEKPLITIFSIFSECNVKFKYCMKLEEIVRVLI